jgi:hypothetical protein
VQQSQRDVYLGVRERGEGGERDCGSFAPGHRMHLAPAGSSSGSVGKLVEK